MQSSVTFRRFTVAHTSWWRTNPSLRLLSPCIQSRRFGFRPLHNCPYDRILTKVAETETTIASSTADPEEISISPASPSSNLDVKGEMLAPSAANKNWVRLLALSVAVLLAARATPLLPGRGAAFVHVLAHGAWLGSTIYVTFFAGITMFKNLPRQVFGRLQSKLFPQYFALHSAAITLILGTLLATPGGAGTPQLAVLGASLAVSLLNLLWLEPSATKVMFERYELENAPVRDKERIQVLYKEFGKWHGSSSLANLVGVVGAVAHTWWLASKLLLVG